MDNSENYQDSRLATLFIATSWLAAGIIWFYSISRWTNLVNAIRSTEWFSDIPRTKAGMIGAGKEPHVTIQICMYNEGSVVEETVKRACTVDWPADKLTVHLLDDSTDKHSCDVAKTATAFWSEEGVKIKRLTRQNRIGYKAGSLRHHFETSVESDFIAHFDADHHMEPDFLKRAMPHFFDEHGQAKEEIGLVQTPWGYYNTHQNVLTEADALALDTHHVIEQTARGATYECFGFNGTGGIWRKSAVEAAGGWTWDSVTEDLALSYNASIAGYKHTYVRDMPQRLELPGNIQAFMQQKHRWTKGFLQVFRITYWKILWSRKVSAMGKWEAFCQISAPILYFPATFLVIAIPIYVHNRGSSLLLYVIFVPCAEVAIASIVSCYAKVAGRGKGEYQSFLSRTYRLLFVPASLAVKLGMSLFEMKAVLEGLFSNDATFLTTPKEGLTKNSASANFIKRQLIDDVIAILGLAIGIFRWAFLLHPSCSVASGLGHILVGTAYVGMNASFLAAKYGMARLTHTFSMPTKAKMAILSASLLLLLCFGNLFSSYHSALQNINRVRVKPCPLVETGWTPTP